MRLLLFPAVLTLAACGATTTASLNAPSPAVTLTLDIACAGLDAYQAKAAAYIQAHQTDAHAAAVAADVAAATGPLCTPPYASNDAQAIEQVAAGAAQLAALLTQKP
jgi:uncharacterized protein (DUF1501 family)